MEGQIKTWIGENKALSFHTTCIYQAPVVQKVDSAIHLINLNPVDDAIGFPNTYPLNSDLSDG